MTQIAQAPAERSAAATPSSPAARPESTPPAERPPVNDYADLKRRIKAAGLLEKQPFYYAVNILFVLSLLGLNIAVLVLVESLWIQLFNAVLLAFVFTQISFLGHDATHRQIFRSTRNNDIAGTVFWNVLLGMSNRWFIYRHTRHHARPNELDGDPDADLIILSLSETQARRRQGPLRFFVRYQVLLLPFLSLEMIVLHYASYRFLVQRLAKYPPIEPLLTLVSIAAFVALPYYFLGFWPALLFVLVNQVFFGVYFVSVIAANHKGMPFWEQKGPLDFLRQQVVTARNVKSNPLIDFWYGGLNFQIEHHLFPNMPRNKLRDAQVIVRRFCEERGIPYCETGLVQSFRDILEALHAVSAAEAEAIRRAA